MLELLQGDGICLRLKASRSNAGKIDLRVLKEFGQSSSSEVSANGNLEAWSKFEIENLSKYTTEGVET